jgi:hypothetical protein
MIQPIIARNQPNIFYHEPFFLVTAFGLVQLPIKTVDIPQLDCIKRKILEV